MLGQLTSTIEPPRSQRYFAGNSHITRRVLACIALACLHSANLSAQQSTTQSFVVNVPTKAAVVAPSAVSIAHDLSDSPQAFPGQFWSVNANALSGMVVEFSVNQAFTHQTQQQAKSDAELSVRIHETVGPARWTATKAIDATSFAAADEHAIVQVTSDSFGSAQIDLGIRFLNNGELVMGAYSTTVFCTVTVP